MTGLYMTWYRYWLEVRPRLLALAVFALWIGFNTVGWSQPMRSVQAIFGNALAQSMGTESGTVWLRFTNQMAFFAWAVGVILMSNGLRTAFTPRHASISYTLTLPVSRRRLISTHFAGNCAAAVIAAALTLAARCATLWLRGDGIPFIPLAISIAFATLFVIGWIALLSALSMIMHEGWAVVASIAFLALSVRWTWVTVTALPAYGEFPWVSVAALLAISALALAFSLSRSREQEFG